MADLQDKQTSVQTAVYNALKNNIMSLQLKPGSTMSTQEIATKLSVSRTPVREAFIRLQRDGLLIIYPQKETIVSKINLQRVKQERFIRESLECEILELLLAKATDLDIAKIKENIGLQEKAIAEQDHYKIVSLDNLFHEMLFTIAGQPLSWETITNVSNHYSRVRMMTAWAQNVQQKTLMEHKALLKFIEEKNLSLAKEHMKKHLHQLESEIKDIVTEYPDYFEKDQLSIESRFDLLLSL